MKLTREIKTAILVLAAILLFIWGYSFLKGRDLLVNYKTLFVEYNNVEGLALSAPVTLNGFIIGKVDKITLNNNTGKLLVEMQIKSDFPITQKSLAQMYSPSLMGGKQIAIIPNSKTNALANDGDYLVSDNKLGLTEELSGQIEPVKDKLEKVLDNANVMVEGLNTTFDAKAKQNLQQSLQNLNETLAQFKEISKSTNALIAENKSKLNSTLSNVDKASLNFAKVSDSISKIELNKSVKKLESTLSKVNAIMADVEQGKGTMGKLMKDEALYNNFTKTSKELELLLQDLRLNPTRYINVSLFGKKNKPYVPPTQEQLNQVPNQN